MIGIVLLAAGAGRRMGHKDNKIFLPLGPKSVFQWSLSHILEVKNLTQVVIVHAEGEKERIQGQVNDLLETLPHVLREVSISYVQGGAERQDSVANGVATLGPTVDLVLIHDGARPMAQADLFMRTAHAATLHGAAVVAVKTTDTVKRVCEGGLVLETLQRSELYNMQTPQGFQRALFEEALAYAKDKGFQGTDDVSLVEFLGKPVHIVEGDYRNCKITTPNDLVVAKSYLGIKGGLMRVGMGYDVHRLVAGRPCILCGVRIDSSLGPEGHSDADVPVHALMDALLGAAGLKDIGYYFPPEDPAYKGISSMLLLEKVNSLLKDKGLKAYNIDIMVISETPKLKPHIDAMKDNLGRALGLPPDRISVKATTNESLGAIGRREGIAAQACVTVIEGEV